MAQIYTLEAESVKCHRCHANHRVVYWFSKDGADLWLCDACAKGTHGLGFFLEGLVSASGAARVGGTETA